VVACDRGFLIIITNGFNQKILQKKKLGLLLTFNVSAVSSFAIHTHYPMEYW